MASNTRERFDALHTAARAFITARGLDVTLESVPRPWAAEFAEQQGCTIETARRHLVKAARRMRHAAATEAERKWGGTRPGAGRPCKSDEAE